MPDQRNYTSAGNFSAIVEDGLGCTAQANFSVVNEPLTVAATPKPVVCKGQNNGEISVAITGGAPDFTTTLLNSRNASDIVAGTNALPSRNPRYINLASGTYFVRTVDRENCEVIVQVDNVEEAPASFEAMLENPTHPVSCNDAAKADGNARINLMGGKAPYRITWVDRGTTPSANKEATTSSSFFVVPDLTFGTTTVNIVDFYGCSRSVDIFIDRPAVNLEVKVSIVNNEDCINNIGSLSLDIDGGRPFPNGGPLYNVMWYQGNTLIASNTTVLNNLETGVYRYTVEDANGCVRDRTAEVLGPQLPTITIESVSQLICKDGENAAIDISVAGGTAPYTYLWSNGAKTQDIANLKAGEYTGTVTDAKGCTIVSGEINIINPDPLTITPETPSAVSACGVSDGSFGISNVVPSDRGPFSYTWKRVGDPTFNPGNVMSLNGTLAAGTYLITVRDNRGCTQTVPGTVGQPSTIAATATVNEISCATEAQGVTGNGSINLTVSGGVQPYMFMWSNGSTESGISNLSAGTYYGTVTDAEGCFILAEHTFVSPMAIAITDATVSNVKCNGGSTGAIMVDVAGGTAPLRFNWSNGSTTEDLMNIPAGTYQGTITDARGCVFVSGEVEVKEPVVLEVELAVTPAGCTDKNDGRIMSEVMGGTAPYTYMWSNGETTMDIADLEPGDYTVTVTDANACMMMMMGTVILNDNLPAPVITVTNGENEFCVGGTVAISADAGYLNYLWSVGDKSDDGEATIVVGPDEPGMYDVFVTVTNACGTEQNSNIIEVVVKAFPETPVVTNIGDTLLVANIGESPEGVSLQWKTFDTEGKEVILFDETSDTLVVNDKGDY